MYDVTVAHAERENVQELWERQKEIDGHCWRACTTCHGKGFSSSVWEAKDGGPDYVLRVNCMDCDGMGTVQIDDPNYVQALYNAADDLREEMGIEFHVRIFKGLALAIDRAVTLGKYNVEVRSQSVEDRVYELLDGICTCPDAEYQAPKVDGLPVCKHRIAMWLVVEAQKEVNRE